MPIVDYIKHAVRCRCFPAALTVTSSSHLYEFITITPFDDKGEPVETLASCDNCGAVHKVLDACKSEILALDESVVPRADELAAGLPEKLVEALQKHDVLKCTWEEAALIFEHSLWGKAIVLARERHGDDVFEKSVVVDGPEKLRFTSKRY